MRFESMDRRSHGAGFCINDSVILVGCSVFGLGMDGWMMLGALEGEIGGWVWGMAVMISRSGGIYFSNRMKKGQ